jgi:MFS family permease
MASASFAPLRHRSFALALGSNFISSTGTWMQSVALGVYLTETTHNPLWLGLLTLAAWLPAIIGSPLGGVMADRVKRERWIQLNNLILAGTAIALACAELTHHLHPLLACVLAIAEGLCGSASWAAWQSLMPDLVGEGEVLAAVSLGSAQFNLGRILGPVLAGLLLALGSPGWCFVANAASFVVVVIAFAFVRSRPRARVQTPLRLWGDTKVGLHATWRHRACRYAVTGVGVVGLFISPFITLVPAMAIEVLHAGRVGVSWLVTAQGVGAVLGALTWPALARRTSRGFVLRVAVWSMPALEAAYAASRSLWLSTAAITLLGAAYVGTMTGLNTTVQLHAPTAERSRVLSVYIISLSVLYPLGAVWQSSLARTHGVRAVSIGAAIVFALVVAVASWSRGGVFDVMGTSPSEVPLFVAD